MTVQLQPTLRQTFPGAAALSTTALSTTATLLTTVALLNQASPAAARVVVASSTMAQAQVASPSLVDCDPETHGTILSAATASMAALGNDDPWAQASVLFAGLACLTGGSLWLKQQLP